jgi:hypothetical protein
MSEQDSTFAEVAQAGQDEQAGEAEAAQEYDAAAEDVAEDAPQAPAE